MERWNAVAMAAGIGAVAGLRALTAPAVVSWAAAHYGLPVRDAGVSWLASPTTANVLAVAAAGELVADKLPATPDRTLPGSLALRVAAGTMCGAVVAAAVRRSLTLGAVAGGVGAILASFTGRELRRYAAAQGWEDAPVALAEDLVAIGGASALANLAR